MAPNMNVLYVEDNPFDIELTLRELKKTAPEINLDIVTTKSQALVHLSSDTKKYDLILSDRKLPDGDGLSLLIHVRSHLLDVAFVLITGASDQDLVITALKAGADDYIVKSSDYLKRLPTILQDALMRHQQENARYARPLRVLYIDHNQMDVDLTMRHFSSHAPFIRLEAMRTAHEALLRLPDQKMAADYDLLLVDYRLPGMNALEIIKELRQVRKMDLPIVVVTGQGDEDVALQAFRFGATDYLPKNPGYLYQLAGKIEDAYHRVELERERAALQESERRYRSLFDDSPTALLLEDFSTVKIELEKLKSAGHNNIRAYFTDHPAELKVIIALANVIDANKAAVKLYDASSKEHLLGNLSCILPDTSKEIISEQLVSIADGKTDFELEGINRTLKEREIMVQVRWQAAPGSEKTLERVMVSIQDISIRYQNERTIKQQLQRLEAMRRIDEAILTKIDLDNILSLFLKEVLILLQVEYAAVWLYQQNTHTLTLRAYQSNIDLSPQRITLKLGEELVGESALEKSIYHSIDESGLEHGEQYALPLIAKKQLVGVFEVRSSSKIQQDEEWLNFLTSLQKQVTIAIDNLSLFINLQLSVDEIRKAYDETIESLARALELRDRETVGHSKRVTELTISLARKLEIPDAELDQIRRGAWLHDIGKIGIPDNIFYKSGPLTPSEWEIIHKHPIFAYDILKPIDFLRPALDIPYCHHEKWDGTGYPRGLRGEEIPLSARIFAVVDVWDALLSDRPYHDPISPEQATQMIIEQSGKHFDPKVVDAFLSLNLSGAKTGNARQSNVVPTPDEAGISSKETV